MVRKHFVLRIDVPRPGDVERHRELLRQLGGRCCRSSLREERTGSSCERSRCRQDGDGMIRKSIWGDMAGTRS